MKNSRYIQSLMKQDKLTIGLSHWQWSELETINVTLLPVDWQIKVGKVNRDSINC